MRIYAFLILFLCNSAQAAPQVSAQVDFTEKRNNNAANASFKSLKKSTAESESQNMDQVNLIESSHNIYSKFTNRIRVPGFISSSAVPQLARIAGPDREDSMLRVGDTVYLRWSAAPMPMAGERFSTFAPAIVLQNVVEPSEFEIVFHSGPIEKLPKDRRLAGYFYETNARLKVLRVHGGMVEAILEKLSNVVSMGDGVMMTPPLLPSVTPVHTGTQLSAAVVCGSPFDRLSTTRFSFIYINRGSRDGIQVGRVLESIETVKLDEAVGGTAPEVSNGEAIVVHTTDSYSTAMITKQFDVIRVGSLLRTKSESSPIARISPFDGFSDEIKLPKPSDETRSVPSLDNLPGSTDNTLPEPRKKPADPTLSELDELERSMKLDGLTPGEKARLDKLSKQEKLSASKQDHADEETDENSGAPVLENSFKDGKKNAKGKKEKKIKKKSKNDEEELNLLMMQN